MARRQINLSAKQRQEVVLRLLRGEAKAGELAREYTISEPTVYKWREQFLEAGLSGLDGQRGEEAMRREFDRELAKRDQVIGELTVALRVIKKAWRVSSDTRIENASGRCHADHE